jgi:cytochrome c peroxidase
MKTKYVLWCALASAGALFPWLGGAEAPPDGRLPFTDAEVRAILSHGPWPAPGKNDPTNRASGKREAIEFGERLFFDTRLSGSGRFSCGTCHVPERNWTDNQTRGVAVGQMDRNTPTLMNVRLGHSFGWDGGSDSLWSQSIRPMLDPRELASSARQIAELVRSDEQLSCRYRKTFGSPPSATDDEAVLVGIGKALAAFQETLDSAPTPFDKFRDALARGERITPWSYSDAAQRGLKIFIGKGACNTCHSGPIFTNGEFHDNGFSTLDAPGRTDPGRLEGIERVRESRFNLLGPYNDDPARSTAAATRGIKEERREASRDLHAFKVPTLRNMLLTSPYGHHGEILSIADIVRHYSDLDTERLQGRAEGRLKALKLTAAEQTDLVVFLESLTSFSNPWRPEDMGRCY